MPTNHISPRYMFMIIEAVEMVQPRLSCDITQQNSQSIFLAMMLTCTAIYLVVTST